MVPAGGEGVGQAAETESTLALAENVYVNLPRPMESETKALGTVSLIDTMVKIQWIECKINISY